MAADSFQISSLRTRAVLYGFLIAAAYVAAGRVGLSLAFLSEQITTVWAPTGIALAALLLGGMRFWPAIWLGALITNAAADAPTWAVPVIATGNTLEAVVATWILRRRVPGFDTQLHRVADVTAFVVIAVALCTMISATIGVTVLSVAGVEPWNRFAVLWFEWWFGDALGAALVAPAILTSLDQRWSQPFVSRAGAFTAAGATLTYVVFGGSLGPGTHRLEFLVFPVLVVAAVVGGPAITALTTLSTSIVALWLTVNSLGPFAGTDAHLSLVLLQVFMGVLGITAMLLAAATSEGRRAETEARSNARALSEREAMLRLAQQAGGVASFEWDFSKQIAQCSAEFFRVFGLHAADGVMTGAQWAEYVHPEDRERMATHLARALAGVEPASADYRVIAADGTTRWLTYAGQIQRTSAGQRMLGTVVDITDRKRLENELRHHAAEIERLLETIGEGFVALDRECRIAYVNAAAENMVGRRREELIGHAPWGLFPPEVIGESRRVLESALVDGVPRSYQMHVPAWNRWFEARVYPSVTGLSVFFADITARVAADAALNESRDVLALAMRGGGMGAWARTVATDEVWWSRELEELFGLSAGGFRRTEAGFFEFVHHEDRDAVRRAVDGAIRSGTDYVVEFRFKRADSEEWRWMEGRGRAVYGDDGAPRTLYGLGIDVTARKRTEVALQAAKAAAEQGQRRLEEANRELRHRVLEQQTLLDVLPIGIGIAADRECRQIRTNRAFAETLGLPPEKNASKTAPPDERPTNFRVLTPDGTEVPDDELPLQVAAREGREVRDIELDIVHEDGRVVRLLEYAAPLLDEHGVPRGAVGAFVDVTALHHARAELRQEVEIRTTLAQVGASLARELHGDALVQAVTDAATQLTEAEFGAFFYNVTDDRGGVYQLYALAGAPQEAFASFPHPRATDIFGPTFRGEEVIRLDDVTDDPRYGHYEPYRGMPPGHLPVRSYLAVPVVGRGGMVLGGLFFGHSQAGMFTERHQALASGVAGWAAIALDNARLYRDAEEANRLKDEFLATLSHELRTPLNAVLGWTRMLRQGAVEPGTYERAFETIERNAAAQAQLVDDLLDISRIVAGKLQIKADVVDLASVISNAVDTVQAGAFAKNLGVLVRLPAPQRIMVIGDADRLQQVVWNLLSNAIKFTPAGGRVEVELRSVDARAELVVRDTGQGIDPSFRPHLFQRFRQMDASKTRLHGGLGLGLSIVRHIVEAHGGEVRADSQGVGLGSAFVVVLPLKAAQQVLHADLDPAEQSTSPRLA